MGLADTLRRFMPKAEKLAREHPDEVHKGVGEAGDLADKLTHDRYESQIDTAEQKADEALGAREQPGHMHEGGAREGHPGGHEGHEH